MRTRTISSSAGSRLHFGLFSFRATGERQFGGIGVIVKEPENRLVISESPQFAATGFHSDRVRQWVTIWASWHQMTELPACRIDVQQSGPLHCGLGIGTQLGLSVANALNAWHQWEVAEPDRLAASVRRGVRSAVGTYGFFAGGLVAEWGKDSEETLSPRWRRIEMPPAWRFVLLTPRGQQGLHGRPEREAFVRLPPVPAAVTRKLIEIVESGLLPAARAADCQEFGKLLYQYGHLSGECFAEIQGGPYNGPLSETLVSRLRSLGVEGVGQSSWGPTLFALTDSELSAATLMRDLSEWPELANAELRMTAVRNQGVAVSETD